MENKIKCPKCGYIKEYLVAISGTGTVSSDGSVFINNDLSIDNIDDSTYAECPSCEYKTFFHEEFWDGNCPY